MSAPSKVRPWKPSARPSQRRESADTALARTKSLDEKIDGLEQQLGETRNSAATPDARTQATINAASELASSAKPDIAALSAKTGEIESGMTDIRSAVANLKSALQAAAGTGGGAGQADVNLKFDELAQRIAKLETIQAQPPDDTLADEVAALRDQLAAATENLENWRAGSKWLLPVRSPRSRHLPRHRRQRSTRSGSPHNWQRCPTPSIRATYQAELSALEDTAKLTLNLPALPPTRHPASRRPTS